MVKHSQFTAIKKQEYCVIPSQLPFNQHWNTVASPPNYHLTSAGIMCHPLPITI